MGIHTRSFRENSVICSRIADFRGGKLLNSLSGCTGAGDFGAGTGGDNIGGCTSFNGEDSQLTRLDIASGEGGIDNALLTVNYRIFCIGSMSTGKTTALTNMDFCQKSDLCFLICCLDLS